MRIVLDTNVLLSALIKADSVPASVLDAWREDRYVLLSHEWQLAEVRTVSRRDHLRNRFRPAEVGKLVNRIRANAEMATRLPHVRRSDDPLDDFLLALCEAGHADYLVTGDKPGLLALGTHAGATILTARAMLDRLRK